MTPGGPPAAPGPARSSGLTARLQTLWRHRGPGAFALRPLAGIYGAVTALDRALHRIGWRRIERLPVPVVVVGNVVAGGAGKTPVVIALVEHLIARGRHPGVVSRGYGRTGDHTREVTPTSDPKGSGDEPLLIARRTGAPVFVARRRADAGRALLAAHPQVDVIVSDDGLQHHALARDIEICVFDSRGIGNGWRLPAGPLREPWPRTADFVLRTDDAPALSADAFTLHRQFADDAVRADGQAMPLAELARLSHQPGADTVALAGIASPTAFFDQLRAAGVKLARLLPLPDHYDFESTASPNHLGSLLVCTEKDAVKLWSSRPDAWAVPLTLEIDAGFWSAFDARLAAIAPS